MYSEDKMDAFEIEGLGQDAMVATGRAYIQRRIIVTPTLEHRGIPEGEAE